MWAPRLRATTSSQYFGSCTAIFQRHFPWFYLCIFSILSMQNCTLLHWIVTLLQFIISWLQIQICLEKVWLIKVASLAYKRNLRRSERKVVAVAKLQSQKLRWRDQNKVAKTLLYQVWHHSHTYKFECRTQLCRYQTIYDSIVLRYLVQLQIFK